ncbi:MAG: hypothetical protein EOP87_01575 [Verrucomicrobiaceae bacterium]|nr:MAG: hypothetical protein EOP87_01575 [Verrucomicrobiaceae bacterium]
MTTPVLDVRGLTRLMRHHSARADRGGKQSCRDEEEDAVLLGKLILLDDLGWRVDSEEMSATETMELRAATNELGRAVETLTARIAAASKEEADAGEIDLTDEEGGGA